MCEVVMSKPVYSLDQVIDQLDGGIHWYGDTVTYSIASTEPDSPTYDGFVELGSSYHFDIDFAFERWDDLIAIDLVKTADPGNISLAFYDPSTYYPSAAATYGSYLDFGDSTGAFLSASIDVNLDGSGYSSLYGFGAGYYSFYTLLHEIGHALGLDHPGDYNGAGVNYDDNAVYAQDTIRYSIMSYFAEDADGSESNYYQSSVNWLPQTPMIHDIAAIQAIYGADMTTRTGDDVYGFGGTFDPNFSLFPYYSGTPGKPIFTIWDAGGTDTLNFSGYSVTQTISLIEGTYSSIGGLTNNIGIAFGVDIENAIGGRGRDHIVGNDLGNHLEGNRGDDEIFGGAGSDTIVGGSGNDMLSGGDDADGLDVDRAVFTGTFADYAVSYILASQSYSLTDLRYGSPDGTDLATGFEEFEFSDGVVTETELRTYIPPNAADDRFTVAEDSIDPDSSLPGRFVGNLFADNGNGLDLHPFGDQLGVVDVGGETSSSGTITAMLASGARLEVTSGNGNFSLDFGDTYDWLPEGQTVTETIGYSISDVSGNTASATATFVITGIDSNDYIVGTSGGDRLFGGIGNDRILGAGGTDRIDGGTGNDRILGGNHNDLLIGRDGNDAIYGQNGNDRLFGGNDRDFLYGGNHNDLIRAGAGNDILKGEKGDDKLIGDAGNDWIIGGVGRDYLFGGAGRDRFDFDSVWDSKSFGRDLIRDFTHREDKIDVSTIDANTTTAGNDRFHFIGDSEFTKTAGELRFFEVNRYLRVEVDVNGDGRADMLFDVLGEDTLHANDFIL